MEYKGANWDPHPQKDKDKLERVNRRAARFVANDYDQNILLPPPTYRGALSGYAALAMPRLAHISGRAA